MSIKYERERRAWDGARVSLYVYVKAGTGGPWMKRTTLRDDAGIIVGGCFKSV